MVGGKNGFDIGRVFVEVSGLHLNVARLQTGHLLKAGQQLVAQDFNFAHFAVAAVQLDGGVGCECGRAGAVAAGANGLLQRAQQGVGGGRGESEVVNLSFRQLQGACVGIPAAAAVGFQKRMAQIEQLAVIHGALLQGVSPDVPLE